MRLYEKWRPRNLTDILGQPAVRSLEQFACEPYPSVLILEGDSGTGKTCAAMILADMLGDSGWFGSTIYKLNGADLNVETARRFFDPPPSGDSPFRYQVAADKFHVLRIEELEWVSPQCQRYLKEAIEEAQRRWRVIVVATSNDASRLEKALRHRFKPYSFSAGPVFSDAINEWLPTVWVGEVGANVELPYCWETFGWEDDHFSARLALDRLEAHVLQARSESREVAHA